MTKNYTYLKIANTVALAATVLVNILANALPIGGLNTGQISAMYPTLFTPAGFTFGIWGIIYGLLALFIVMQYFTKDSQDIKDIGIYFVLSCIFNILWIFTWHNQMIILSTLLIIALFGTLMKIYVSTRDSSLIPRMTFSIYYAWITVASVISIFVVVKTLTGGAPVTPIEPRMITADSAGLTDIILIGGDPQIASYVSVFEYIMATAAAAVAAGIAILHIYGFGDYFYTATILWAIAGIMVRQITAPVQPVLMLSVAGIAAAVILYIIARREISLCELRKKRRYASLK